MLAHWKQSYDKPSKKQRHHFADKVNILKAMVFPVDMYGCESWTIKLSTKELMLLNCDVGEDACESLGLQGDQSCQS